MKKSKSGLPSYITTYNFYKGVGTSQQGEISLQIACNNSCVFCYTAHYTHEPNTRQIYFELMKAREAGLEWINFTGGEPTLRPDFFEILDYANRLRFPVIYLKTHGRRFSDMEFAKRVVGKVSFVHISIHGHNAEVHDEVTRTPGSFDEAIQGIKNLVSLGVPVVGMTVICRINQVHLKDTVALLDGIGVHSHSFAYPYPSGYALDFFEKSFPRHEECKPFIFEAMDAIDATGKHAQLDNVPLCHMPGYEKFANHMWFRALPNDNHEWGADCGTCMYRPICNGIPAYYIKQRGWDEFKPITTQIEAEWTEPRAVTLSRHAVPHVVGRFLQQDSGGTLNGRRLIALTHDGYNTLAAAFGRMTLGEIQARMGDRALRFVVSTQERGLSVMREGPPPQPQTDALEDRAQPVLEEGTRPAAPGRNAIVPLAEDAVLEHPLYRKHPPYPIVTLI